MIDARFFRVHYRASYGVWQILNRFKTYRVNQKVRLILKNVQNPLIPDPNISQSNQKHYEDGQLN